MLNSTGPSVQFQFSVLTQHPPVSCATLSPTTGNKHYIQLGTDTDATPYVPPVSSLSSVLDASNGNQHIAYAL